MGRERRETKLVVVVDVGTKKMNHCRCFFFSFFHRQLLSTGLSLSLERDTSAL